ncbi:MAG: hypothetical protein K6L76_00135 [Agarilytica sp.]
MKKENVIKTKWHSIAEKFDARELRERGIIAGLAMVVVWSLINFTVIIPIEAEDKKLDKRMKSVQKELKNLQTQELVLAQALMNDPNASKKKQIRQLLAKLETLEKDLQELSVGLISAEKLPQALHDVLKNMGTLKLNGMQTQQPSRLHLQTSEEVATETLDEEEKAATQIDGDSEKELDTERVGVFKHSVIVQLEGNYFDVVNYLEALESLPWKIYWQGIDYEVKKFPKAKVTLEVYTLSTEEGLLGV